MNIPFGLTTGKCESSLVNNQQVQKKYQIFEQTIALILYIRFVERKKVTIQDIAAMLEINASTVSRALNDHPRISAGTKKRVMEAAVKLNYDYNHIAAALRKGKSKIVGVIVPKLDRSFFASIVRGIEEVVNEAGYNVMICQSNDIEEIEAANVEALLRTRVDGIIASIARETKRFAHFERVKAKGIPLVLFDRVQENLQVSTVEIDDYQGGYIAASHLIEQGCRRIAHFSGAQNLNIYEKRYNGYRQAVEDYGLPHQKEWVVESDLSLESGRLSMEKLLECSPRPDAVFSASDYAAIGALQVLKERGVRVPAEIALVGFSNEPFTAFVDPALTSVEQFSKEIGRSSAQVFLEKMKAPEEYVAIRKTKLQPKLIVRSSSLRKE